MTDLFLGRSCSEAYKCISAGTAYTLTTNFQPDKVVVNNLTAWAGAAGTVGKFPKVTWFRDLTTNGYAYQQVVVDTAAGASYNFLYAAANGFTVADTSGGVTDEHKSITAITAANPCVVTAVAHGFQSNQIVRITDLGSDMPTARGMNEVNNNRYRINVLTVDTFSLEDVISGEAIDSTSYTAYVSGGFVTLETKVMRPNNPYTVVYTSNPFTYDPIEYKLTLGTAVMGANDDSLLIEVYKFGQVYDLGDLA